MSRKTFKILTLGCKVNQYESKIVADELRAKGAVEADDDEHPDIVVVNTCTVTHRSDADARAMVRRARREYPDCRIVAAGCYAALEPEKLLEAGADLVRASADKSGLAKLSWSSDKGIKHPTPQPAPLQLPPVFKSGGRKRAFLKVQDGCEAFCAYCIVPYARGPSRSLASALVAEGLEMLAAAGHLEVVLSGIHLGCWGQDLEPAEDIGDLLEMAHQSSVAQVRLSSIEPLEITDRVLSRMAASEKFCRHLHVPLQSGSDEVLDAMGRPYNSSEALERIDAAFAALEGLCVGLDVITGFPGETDSDFARTFEYLGDIPFSYLHVFPFSPRKGTRAFEMADRPPPLVATRRAARLRELSLSKREAFHRSFIGKETLVLPEKITGEGNLRGHTQNYLDVEIQWRGEFPDSRIRAALVGWNKGRLIGVPTGERKWI